MNNAIQVYSNADFSVRTTQNEDGTVWFVARDIAEALEYSESNNTTNIFSNVPEIWKGIKRINTPGGEQKMLCLTEQGLYFFLGRSDKPKALPYQMWIAGDVVPSIHATGSYSIIQNTTSVQVDPILGAKVVLEASGIKNNQLTLALDKVYKSYTGRSVLQMAEIQLIMPTQEQLLNPTQIGKHFGVSARTINNLLMEKGYQRKIGDGYEPMEAGKPYAVMLDVNKWHGNGTPTCQLKWRSGIIDEISSFFL